MTERGLLDQFAELVAEKVAERMGANNGQARLLNTKAAAKYLGVTEDALRHWRAQGKLPVVKSDRHLRFDVKDLDRLIEENKHKGI